MSDAIDNRRPDETTTQRIGPCPARQELLDCLHQRVDADRSTGIREHVAACPLCLDEWADRLEFLQLIEEPVPPELEDYVVTRLLGRGGFGDVWLAQGKTMALPRAVKCLHSNRFSNEETAQLYEEADFIDQLGAHKNRIQVYAMVPTLTGPVMVMRYLDGGTLADASPMDWDRAVGYVVQAADGLAEVHEKGRVHGDIKPQNILIDRERDLAVLTDFGLAIHARGEYGGTPGFTAPEIARGERYPASDVFSLAATLYYLMHKRTLYPAKDLATSLAQAAVPLTHIAMPSDAPNSLEGIMLRALHPDPSQRLDREAFRRQIQAAPFLRMVECLDDLVTKLAAPVRFEVVAEMHDTTGQHAMKSVRCHNQRDGQVLFPPHRPLRGAPGDELILYVQSDRDGYVTLLSFGAEEEPRLLVFAENAEHALASGQPAQFRGPLLPLSPSSVEEHIVAIWTPSPNRLSALEWCRRLKDTWRQLRHSDEAPRAWEPMLVRKVTAPLDWTAVMLTIRHEPCKG